MKRTPSPNRNLLTTLLAIIVFLAACGGTSNVGTTSDEGPTTNDATEGSLPLADQGDGESTQDAEPTEDTLPVPDEDSVPVEIDDEHVIVNEIILDPQVTTPTALVVNPENDAELWVRFTGGDPNCTAASVTLLTETPDTCLLYTSDAADE